MVCRQFHHRRGGWQKALLSICVFLGVPAVAQDCDKVLDVAVRSLHVASIDELKTRTSTYFMQRTAKKESGGDALTTLLDAFAASNPERVRQIEAEIRASTDHMISRRTMVEISLVIPDSEVIRAWSECISARGLTLQVEEPILKGKPFSVRLTWQKGYASLPDVVLLSQVTVGGILPQDCLAPGMQIGPQGISCVVTPAPDAKYFSMALNVEGDLGGIARVIEIKDPTPPPHPTTALTWKAEKQPVVQGSAHQELTHGVGEGWVITGVGANVKDNNLVGLRIQRRQLLLENGKRLLGPPEFHDSGNLEVVEAFSSVRDGEVVVGIGMDVRKSNVVLIKLYSRAINLETGRLEGPVQSHVGGPEPGNRPEKEYKVEDDDRILAKIGGDVHDSNVVGLTLLYGRLTEK